MKIDSAPRSGTLPQPEADLAPTELPRVSQSRLGPRARLWIRLAIVLLLVIFVGAIHSIITPFIWAAVVAYILNPVVRVVQRHLLIRHGLSVALVMVVVIGLLGWGLLAGVLAVRGDIAALTNALAQLDAYLTTYLPNAGTLIVLGVPIQVAQLVHSVEVAVNDLPRGILHSGWSIATNMVETVLKVLTFLISTFYLLLDTPRLGRWLYSRIPERHRDDLVVLTRDINTVLSEYLRAEIILIALMSAVSLIALSVLGMRFALILAPIVGFLEIFPIIGPFFAITMVAIAALIAPPNFGLSHVGYAVIVALVFFILRQIEDYLVIPNVVGHAVKLHPVLILFALLSGATLGGILGMFLAVPVTGALKVLGEYTYDRVVA